MHQTVLQDSLSVSEIYVTKISYLQSENLKGHCYGDFGVCWSKVLKYFTKKLYSDMKLLLEHREENMKRFFEAIQN